MKLLRIGAPGSEIPAVLLDGERFLDVSAGGDFNEEFFGSGKLGKLPALVAQLLAEGARPQPLSGHRIGATIGRPHQIARYYEASGEKYPELSVDIVGWHCSRDEGAIQWRALFKDRSGAPAALEGINIMCVEDGLITTLEAFFDPAQLARPLLMSDASETTHHKGPK